MLFVVIINHLVTPIKQGEIMITSNDIELLAFGGRYKVIVEMKTVNFVTRYIIVLEANNGLRLVVNTERGQIRAFRSLDTVAGVLAAHNVFNWFCRPYDTNFASDAEKIDSSGWLQTRLDVGSAAGGACRGTSRRAKSKA